MIEKEGDDAWADDVEVEFNNYDAKLAVANLVSFLFFTI